MVSKNSRLKRTFHRRFYFNRIDEQHEKQIPKGAGPGGNSIRGGSGRAVSADHALRGSGSAPEDQKDWFDNTMEYLTERYHELAPGQLDELRVLGERFAQPPKVRKAV